MLLAQLQDQVEREQKKRERIIRELKHIAKMKDHLIHVSTHELRTPVTMLRGYLSMMLDGDFGTFSDGARNALVGMSDITENLLGLVSDMLDLIKGEAGKLECSIEHLSATSMVEEIYQTLAVLSHGKHLHTTISLPPEELFLRADRTKLHRILLNLVSNAVKFTPEGGTVGLSLDADEHHITISIRDTGVGMKKEDIPKIFEQFTQIRNPLTEHVLGTGLGLPIVRMFTELMGGDIHVESVEGEGSVFSVRFPMV